MKLATTKANIQQHSHKKETEHESSFSKAGCQGDALNF